MGSRGTVPLTRNLMMASGQPHSPATLLMGKEPTVPIEQEALWAPELVWTLWRRDKSLFLAGFKPCIAEQVA
jgi:hypothetical protein